MFFAILVHNEQIADGFVYDATAANFNRTAGYAGYNNRKNNRDCDN